jgi:putative sterol carrier protein
MTFTWAGIFGICIILSLYPSVITRAVVPIIIITGLGVPFNIKFPDHYLRRLGLPPLAAMRAGLENTAAEAKATLSPGSQDSAPDRHDQPVLNNNQKETAVEQINPVPRPDSIESFMTIMSRGFNAENAKQMKAVMQFTFSGEVEGSCHFEIENGEIRTKGGTSAKPDLIIESPFEIWMDVITGKADGQQMFMQQRYTASGDFSLLLRMNELFAKN